jgi:hypothetical protein
VLRKIFGPKKEKGKEAGENCVMSCMICTLQQRRSGGCDACNMYKAWERKEMRKGTFFGKTSRKGIALKT